MGALVVLLVAVGFGLWATVWLSAKPALTRHWAPDHQTLPSASFDGDRVTVSGVRAFDFRSAEDFTPRYLECTYDISQLTSVWYVVTLLRAEGAAAHTFLSFGFADSSYVAISVEARRERGEPYSLLRGLMRRYEIIYVVGEERDLIGVRAIHRRNNVLLYPIRADPVRIRALFVDMLERANELRARPEFYNTLTNNCTTSILRHVNTLIDPPIRWGPRILLPAYSDQIALRRGLLDTELPLHEARRRFRVSDLAIRYADEPDFSNRIRGRGGQT